ncbi:hypothetical protein TNCV_2103841 [Trichonephila clavipes]|nr:hypothetical protein TNCV_2103841 [Trichonephila clavipes]
MEFLTFWKIPPDSLAVDGVEQKLSEHRSSWKSAFIIHFRRSHHSNICSYQEINARNLPERKEFRAAPLSGCQTTSVHNFVHLL